MIRTGLIWSAILIGAMIAMVIYVQSGIADVDQVPIHWNAQGEVDGYASPSEAMTVYWVLIGTAVFMGGIMAAVALPSATRAELEKYKGLYLGIWIGSIGLCVVIAAIMSWVLLKSVSDPSEEVSGQIWMVFTRGVLAVSAALIMLLGNYLPKTRQNGVVGIRTTWSLSDTDNWERTHRFAGPIFLGAGFISLIASLFLPMMIAIAIFTVAILVACFIPIWYSYKISKEA